MSERVNFDDWKSSIGEGWWPLLRLLVDLFNRDFKTPPTILQVKEKFGGLRVYVYCPERGIPAAKAFAYATFAEALSYTICEFCGSPGRVRPFRGTWLKTVCSDCLKKRGDGGSND